MKLLVFYIGPQEERLRGKQKETGCRAFRAPIAGMGSFALTSLNRTLTVFTTVAYHATLGL